MTTAKTSQSKLRAKLEASQPQQQDPELQLIFNFLGKAVKLPRDKKKAKEPVSARSQYDEVIDGVLYYVKKDESFQTTRL